MSLADLPPKIHPLVDPHRFLDRQRLHVAERHLGRRMAQLVLESLRVPGVLHPSIHPTHPERRVDPLRRDWQLE